MASYDVDPNNVGSTQNPYDFGGVSVSIFLPLLIILNICMILTAFWLLG